MHATWLHRLSLVMLGGLLSTTLVITASSPASAEVVTPPGGFNFQRLAVPSSTITAETLTATERVASVSRLTTARGALNGMVSGPWAKPVKVGAGSLFVAEVGFMAGFEGTNQLLQFAGVENVGLDALLPPTKDPVFLGDYDAAPGKAEGWDADVSFGVQTPVVEGYAGWDNLQESVALSGPALVFNAATGTGNLTITIAGDCLNGGGDVRSFSVRPVVRQVSTGLFSAPSAYKTDVPSSGYLGGACTAPRLTVSTDFGFTLAAGYVFDHLEVRLPYSTVWQSSPSTLAYYPVGHTLYTPGTSSSPRRQWETRWQCSDSSMGQSASSVQFGETDATWPEVPEAVCANGATMVWSEVWEVAPLGGADDFMVSRWDVPVALSDFQRDFPQCLDGSCVADLIRTLPDAGTVSCFSSPEACVDWWTQPEPQRSIDYQCTYAGQDVAITECAFYSTTFNVRTGTDVQTADGTKKSTEVAPFGDPATGDAVPAANPGTTPQVDDDPTCPPSFSMTMGGFGWWVYKGASCALSAAFVPTSTMTEIWEPTTVRWQASGPGVWVASLGDIFDGVSLDESGCKGPGGIFPATGTELYPFSACEEPIKGYAHTAKVIAGFFIGLGGLWAMINAVAKAFGYDLGPAPSAGVQGTLW